MDDSSVQWTDVLRNHVESARSNRLRSTSMEACYSSARIREIARLCSWRKPVLPGLVVREGSSFFLPAWLQCLSTAIEGLDGVWAAYCAFERSLISGNSQLIAKLTGEAQLHYNASKEAYVVRTRPVANRYFRRTLIDCCVVLLPGFLLFIFPRLL